VGIVITLRNRRNVVRFDYSMVPERVFNKIVECFTRFVKPSNHSITAKVKIKDWNSTKGTTCCKS
jgi:hypothetical protein